MFSPAPLRPLSVHLLPALVGDGQLRGGLAVVIDVLRASTTIVHTLAAEAARVIPCAEVEEAKAAAARFPAGEVLLGGERGGLKIGGFHLGNSPAEYTPETCCGKTIVFTTTNGTRALLRAKSAEQALIGAFVNRRAVCRALHESSNPIHLLCAGTEGEISLEDALAAGSIIDDLHQRGSPFKLDDAARLAWYAFRAGADEIAELLRACRGGRNLIDIGLERDIDAAAQIDTIDLVPVLQRDPWQIVASR